MPEAMTYLPPTRIERYDLTPEIGGERQKIEEAYKIRKAYYKGEQPSQLDVIEGQPDDNAVVNMCKITIERMRAFLFPNIPTMRLDENAVQMSPDEVWLKEAWIANGGLELLYDIVENGALSGDVYVRIMLPGKKHPYPRIILYKPSAVITYWKADDIQTVVWHEIKWSVGKKNYLLDVVNRQLSSGDPGMTWELIQYVNETNDMNGWRVDQKEQWTANIDPIIHGRHLPNSGSYYGASDMEHYKLNDTINLIVSEINRIVRYHSTPKTVATGANAEDIVATSVDSLWSVGNPDAKIYNLEMKSDLEAARAQYETLRKIFLALSRVVILEGGVKDFQRVTNAGVRTVFLDMLMKNALLQWMYGTLIRDISKTLLFLGQKGMLTPVIIFNDPLPVDKLETAMIHEKALAMGTISRQMIATEDGNNWGEVLTQLKRENEETIFQKEVKGLTNTNSGV